jgi:uncharacterized protein YuzE
MKLTYDPKHNVAYIQFRDKDEEVEAVQVSDELVVDMAADGTIFGMELLNANEQLRSNGVDKLTLINESNNTSVELPLT